MKKVLIKKQYFIIFISFFLYFLGFLVKDYSPAGAKGDFESFTWLVIQSFKNDLFGSIVNFGKFDDANYPLYYIFSAYLNPFSYSVTSFHYSTFFFAIITTVLLAFTLKSNFRLNLLDCFALSSIILVLPFFAARSYWGTTASLSWITFICSLYYFLNIEYLIKKKVNIPYKTIFLFCFFSSLSIYIRPSFIFFPIFYVFYIFLNKTNYIFKMNSLLTFSFMSLPGFYLVYTWGGLIARDAREGVIFGNLIDYSFIFRNIPLISSIFLFYLLPLILIQLKGKGINSFIKKYLKSFIIFLSIMTILYSLGYLNYLSNFTLGGGAILKLNYLIGKEFIFLFVILSSFGLSIIYEIIKEKPKINGPLLMSILIIFGFPDILYQDYFEPLIFFLIITGVIKSQIGDFITKKNFEVTIIYLIYFIFYHFFSIIYKNPNIIL